TPTGTGTYLYTPAPNYHGPDSFTFTASDGSNTSTPATVSISVLDTSVPATPDQPVSTQADLVVSITGPTIAPERSNATYTITATNNGPTTAQNVSLTSQVPDTATFVSVNISQGTVTNSGGALLANIGTVPVGTTVTLTLVLVPADEGDTVTVAAQA